MVGGVNGTGVDNAALLEVVVGRGVACVALSQGTNGVLPPTGRASGVPGVEVAWAPAPAPPADDPPDCAAFVCGAPARAAMYSRACFICSGVGVTSPWVSLRASPPVRVTVNAATAATENIAMQHAQPNAKYRRK